MPDQTEKRLISFADSHELITAVYKGHNPEEKNYLTYYFLAPTKFDLEFEEELADLELRLFRETKKSFGIMSWPISQEEAVDYPFLGKCVYKKN